MATKDTKLSLVEQTKKLMFDHRVALQAELDKLDADSKSVRDRLADAHRRQQEIEKEINEDILPEVKAFDAQRGEVANQLAAVARSLGGLSTSQSPDAPAE